MIQRIQTVFLVIAVILLVFMFVFPFAEYIRLTDQVLFSLYLKGLFETTSTKFKEFSMVPLLILHVLCLILSFVTIFYFKKRVLQIRLCVGNAILLLGLQGLTYYYAKIAQDYIGASLSFSLVFIFPLISAILVFLALRAIARDEALVRSLDRLR